MLLTSEGTGFSLSPYGACSRSVGIEMIDPCTVYTESTMWNA
jgi:hypothetical protein